jgi:hypothetical protein
MRTNEKKSIGAGEFIYKKHISPDIPSDPGNLDGFVKSPDAALRCIPRHCGVRQARLIPQDLRALPADFLQSHLNFDFCRVHQSYFRKRSETK